MAECDLTFKKVVDIASARETAAREVREMGRRDLPVQAGILRGLRALVFLRRTVMQLNRISHVQGVINFIRGETVLSLMQNVFNASRKVILNLFVEIRFNQLRLLLITRLQ